MSLGIVIGKFLPPHHGHSLLIEAARARCDEVAVLVCDAAWHVPRAGVRAHWIRESFLDASTLVLDPDALAHDDDDSVGWARATRAALGRPPDCVFTSEDYGPRYAGFLGAEHVMVDRERRTVPVSASVIRADPQRHLHVLDPHVRAHYVARVCIVGAESSGKTTLASALAAHYGVAFVPEFGRFYTEAMPDPRRYRWSPADFRRIAAAQAAFEDDAARWTAAPLICDTNPFVTAVFHEAYLGVRDPELEASAQRRRYDLLVLCDPRTPFEQDATGLRVDGERRTWMHARFAAYAAAHGAAVMQATGAPDERLDDAVAAVDALLGAPPPARSSSDDDGHRRRRPA